MPTPAIQIPIPTGDAQENIADISINIFFD